MPSDRFDELTAQIQKDEDLIVDLERKRKKLQEDNPLTDFHADRMQSRKEGIEKCAQEIKDIKARILQAYKDRVK